MKAFDIWSFRTNSKKCDEFNDSIFRQIANFYSTNLLLLTLSNARQNQKSQSKKKTFDNNNQKKKLLNYNKQNA